MYIKLFGLLGAVLEGTEDQVIDHLTRMCGHWSLVEGASTYYSSQLIIDTLKRKTINL